jgi:hypothetical protein
VVEEEFLLVAWERYFPFFRKNNPVVKFLEKVPVNIMHELFQGSEWLAGAVMGRSPEQLDLVPFLFNGLDFESDTESFQFVGSHNISRRVLWRARQKAAWYPKLSPSYFVRMVPWRYVQDDVNGRAVVETLFLKGQDGELVGAAQMIGEPNGELRIHIASDPALLPLLTKHIRGWTLHSGIVQVPLWAIPADDDDDADAWKFAEQADPDYGSEMFDGDEQWSPEDEFGLMDDDDEAHGPIQLPADVMNFLQQNAPKGRLIGMVSASDLRNATLSGYVRSADRELSREQKSFDADILLSYISEKPGL